jgi:hypothetical protein
MRLNLGSWPGMPEVIPMGKGRVQLRLALSVVDLFGVANPKALAGQIDGPVAAPAPKRKKQRKAK